MTQQQHSKRQMIKNTPLTGQPSSSTLATGATETQHRGTSNRLLEMQRVKPPRSCSILQGYKIVHSDTLPKLVSSSALCIQCLENSLQLYQRDTSRAGLKEYLKLYCDNSGYEKKVFYIMLF